MKLSRVNILTIVPAIFLIADSVFAQSVAERRLEEEKRASLEETEKRILEGEPRLLFDYGIWVNLSYYDYHDDDNDSSVRDTYDYTNSADARLWLKAILKPPADADYENEHSFYLRIKDLEVQRKPDDTAGGADNDGPHLDYAYLTLDLRPFWLEAGREYFTVGRGIAYSNVNDGLKMFYLFGHSRLKGFVSHTLPHEDNIDLSIPGYEKESDRYYYGLEYTYAGIPDQKVYGYFVGQRDFSNENPEEWQYSYTYDSEYLGLGAEGKIISNLNYWSEFIAESGESLIFDSQEKKDVDAWAADLGLTYDWDTYLKPRFLMEYAVGSGDSDRVNVTNTQNGNSSGGDENFLYFGYMPIGYAFSARLSNLQFYRLGVMLKPFSQNNILKKCAFGLDYYQYYKYTASAGIYDTDATQASMDVGSEIDFNINWQIFSDLSFNFQYGHFNTGDAYPKSANDSEDYFSAGVNITF